MKAVLNGFKDFVLRGNAIDLAVGVVIGAAFTGIVDAIVTGFIDPLVAAIFGKPDLAGVWTFTVNNAEFSLGEILNALFTFACVAAALYFLVVLPLNKLASLRHRGAADTPAAVPDDVALLREIRDLLHKETELLAAEVLPDAAEPTNRDEPTNQDDDEALGRAPQPAGDRRR